MLHPAVETTGFQLFLIRKQDRSFLIFWSHMNVNADHMQISLWSVDHTRLFLALCWCKRYMLLACSILTFGNHCDILVSASAIIITIILLLCSVTLSQNCFRTLQWQCHLHFYVQSLQCQDLKCAIVCCGVPFKAELSHVYLIVKAYMLPVMIFILLPRDAL